MTTGFQHTEELCQTLFEATSDSIFVSDAQGYFLEVNPQGCALLSYSMEELRQRSWPDLLSTEDRAQELLAWEEGNEDQPVWIEDQVRDKEGRLLTVEIRLRRLAQGHRVAFVRDITEPKRVEETLRRSEQKFETAFRISPDAVNLNRLNDGLYIDINEGFTRITGYTREEVLGQPSLALNIWADPADRARLVQGLRERGQVENLEADFRMKDGTLRTGLMSARLIEVEDEVCLLSITRDITERKQAEAALRLSEARLGGIIDSAMDAILALDETQSIILFNAAAEKMFGYSAAEILGQPLDRLMPERFREIHREYLPVFYRRDEDTSLMGWQRDIVGRRANGEEFPVEASISHIEVNGAKHYTAILRDITERKQAEAALRESEERFRLFMDNSPTTAWMQDEQSRYVYLNRTYEKRFGVRLEEWRGKSIFEVWPAEVATQYRQNDLQMLAAGHLLNFTQRIPNLDGSYSTWWIFKFPFQDASGQRYLAGIGLDISERQQMESALRQSEERFAKAFRASPYALIISHPADGRIIEVNNRWQELCGYSREEAIGQSSGALNIFVNPAERQQVVAKVQKEGSVRDGEMAIRRKTGEVRQVSLSSELIELNNVSCLLTTVRDITESRQIEEALYLTRFSVERAADAIYWLDEAGCIVDVNETACRMLGYSREEMLQRSVFDLDPDITSEFWYKGWQCLKSQQGKTIERVHQTRDGRLIPVEVGGNLVEFRGRTLNCSFARDISERKQAEEAQAKLEEQLRQAQRMESIGRLAGGVAHDFNNLLTVILGYSELMQAQLPREDQMREQLEQIRQAAKRAESLTRQLLAFSRKQMLVPVVLDLNELVTNLRKMLERLIGEDITLTTLLQPGLWSVKADPGQIEQVIMNLIVNARDAMPTGGRLTIETANVQFEDSYNPDDSETLRGPSVRLTVTDTGQGMDEVTLARIFEPFFTTKEQGKGTGLGLATVYGIIKQSGGEITVTSQPGQGTIFSLYLPALETVSTGLAAPPSEPSVQPGRETILMVEDEQGVRRLMRLTLQNYGYTLLEADHGYQALALAQQEKSIDLLLTDVVMPQMDGRELAERLKVLHPRIKVLFISGYTDNEVIRRGLQTAEVEFLPKPFSPAALATKVREILDK